MQSTFQVDLLMRFSTEAGHRPMIRVFDRQSRSVLLKFGTGAYLRFEFEIIQRARDNFLSALSRSYQTVNEWHSVGTVSLGVEDFERALGLSAA